MAITFGNKTFSKKKPPRPTAPVLDAKAQKGFALRDANTASPQLNPTAPKPPTITPPAPNLNAGATAAGTTPRRDTTPPPSTPPPRPPQSPSPAFGGSAGVPQPQAFDQNVDRRLANIQAQIKAQQPPTTPVRTDAERLQTELRDRFANSQRVTSEESDVASQLSALLGSAELGIAGQEGTGRRPLSLVRGRQAQLLEQASLQTKPLQQQLALLQQQRAGQQNALETELGFTEADIAAQKGPDPINVGGQLVQKDPITGEFKAVFGEAPAAETDRFTLSQGQTEFERDADGNIVEIASGGAKPVTGQTLTRSQLFNAELKLAKDFENRSDDAVSTRNQIAKMEIGFNAAERAINEGGSINAATQSVLVTFQKILDPTSVVRESEYARSANGLSLLEQIEGKALQLAQGGAGVTLDTLREFTELGKEFAKNSADSIVNDIRLISNQANSVGANIKNIIDPASLRLLEEATQGQYQGQSQPTSNVDISDLDFKL